MFDKIICINLDRRGDRWQSFIGSLRCQLLRGAQRFNAIDGLKCKPPTWWIAGPGAWGCYRSHLMILEHCLNQKAKSVLIFEDDSVFVFDFQRKFKKFANELPHNWSMLYLGGEHLEKPHKITDEVYEAKNINRMHAYALRGEMIQTLYNHLCSVQWQRNVPIDHYVAQLHAEQGKGIYCPRRWLVGQSGGESDIAAKGIYPERFWPSSETVCSG